MDKNNAVLGVAGLVIAGGAATRMGARKPFVRFQNGVLLDAVIDRVRPQVDVLSLNVRAEDIAACKARYGGTYELLVDAFNGDAGPLGGVVAGLQRLQSLDAPWLATFPCDAPFIPRDLVSRLEGSSSRESPRPVVALASGRTQSLCALWPRRCLDALYDGVASGSLRSVWRALAFLQAAHVEISAEPDAFFNINTREDLAAAERLAAQGGSDRN